MTFRGISNLWEFNNIGTLYWIIPSLGLSGLLREVCEGYQLSALDRFDVQKVAPDDDAFGAAGSSQDFAACHLV